MYSLDPRPFLWAALFLLALLIIAYVGNPQYH